MTWASVPLRRVASLRVEPSHEERPLVTLDQVESGSARLLRNPETSAPEGQARFEPGDVLFSKLRPYLAKSLIVTQPMHGTGELLAIVAGGLLVPMFLLHTTLSRPWIDYADTSSYGTKMPRTSWEAMASYRIPLPPLEEQRRIADFLDDQTARIDQAIRLRQRQVALLGKAIAADVSSDVDDLRRRFGSVRLKQWARSIRQGWSPQCEDRIPDGDEWGVLKAGCVNGGSFHQDEIKTLPAEMHPLVQYRVHPGDLLVNRASGSLDLLGNAAVVPDSVGDRVLLCDKVFRVDVDPASASPMFIAIAWSSERVREELRARVSGAEGMANSLPSTVIKEVLLPAPPIKTQVAWVADKVLMGQSIHAAAAASSDSIALLQERKRSLITAAVAGEFDVATASRRQEELVATREGA